MLNLHNLSLSPVHDCIVCSQTEKKQKLDLHNGANQNGYKLNKQKSLKKNHFCFSSAAIEEKLTQKSVCFLLYS